MWNRGKRAAGLGLSSLEIAELRYQGLFQFIDLTKNFFFSYTYDLTNSLQTNMLSMGEVRALIPRTFSSAQLLSNSRTPPLRKYTRGSKRGKCTRGIITRLEFWRA